MSPYLKALARFRNKIDFEISKQSNAISFDFLLRNYAKGNFTDEDLIELRGYYKGLKVAREMLYRTIAEQKETGGKIMPDNHFADVSKKDTMSLNHALIVLDRSMLLNWIAWTLSKRKPCIFHAFPGKEKDLAA